MDETGPRTIPTYPEGSALLDNGGELGKANVNSKVPGLPGGRGEREEKALQVIHKEQQGKLKF